ncbi:hypothetical protein STCU_00241 [Strigomonas culicis]|uniref:Uncharacterized protein n=1 Tax=Strigomonas culicis TaxID=28005 RepID=S9V7J4_9TRYP|nr:hypothetical protein STCU_08033 [Strigomonas culicis]EPY37056.1 hypothetical protein STCU_00241 [Strigomonas culicis]|eukprot:EPY22926.1 hypothetical protein STCU_08033 [Strigomonas culicis]
MDGFEKAHKPYVPMDTSCPQGNWVEEKRYNRGRPTEGSRRVLCGNWQEEEALEQDMLRREREEQEGRMDGTILKTTFTGTASLDVIRDKGNGHFAGNFTSSPYLTVTAADAANRHLATTHRTDFNARSSDVQQLKRPDLGVRAQQLQQQALEAAAAEKEADDAQRASLRAATTSKKVGGVGGAHAGLDGACATSVYQGTISGQAPACTTDQFINTSANNDTVHALHQEYLSDEPITLYTGNPNTGKTMTVHGKTPVDPEAETRFGRHTNFTEPKYNL